MSIRESLNKFDSVTLKINDESSSMVSLLTWTKNNKLIVTFKNNNSTYKYDKVSGHIFSELINSESIGKYFCENIKPNYECEKVELS